MAKKTTGKAQKKIIQQTVVKNVAAIKNVLEVKGNELQAKEFLDEAKVILHEAEALGPNEELKAQLDTYEKADAKANIVVDPNPPAKTSHCTCPDCGGPTAK